MEKKIEKEHSLFHKKWSTILKAESWVRFLHNDAGKLNIYLLSTQDKHFQNILHHSMQPYKCSMARQLLRLTEWKEL